MSELFSTFHDFSNALCRGTILVAGSHIWCCWLLPSYGHSSWAWLQKKKFPWCCRHCFWPHMSKLLGEQMLCYWCCRLHPLLALTRYIFCIATVSYFFYSPNLNCDGWIWPRALGSILQSGFQFGSHVSGRSVTCQTFARHHWMAAWKWQTAQIKCHFGPKVCTFSLFDPCSSMKVHESKPLRWWDTGNPTFQLVQRMCN